MPQDARNRCPRPRAADRRRILRTIAAHRGIIGGLLHNRAEAEAAVDAAIAKGFALTDLVLVEYAAEPVASTGHFQKRTAFRVGKAYVRANTVNDKR